MPQTAADGYRAPRLDECRTITDPADAIAFLGEQVADMVAVEIFDRALNAGALLPGEADFWAAFNRTASVWVMGEQRLTACGRRVAVDEHLGPEPTGIDTVDRCERCRTKTGAEE